MIGLKFTFVCLMIALVAVRQTTAQSGDNSTENSTDVTTGTTTSTITTTTSGSPTAIACSALIGMFAMLGALRNFSQI